MPDRRDTEFAEILARQPPQNFPVDVVVAECGRVLFEAETVQPFGHIRRYRPETTSLGPINRRHCILSRPRERHLHIIRTRVTGPLAVLDAEDDITGPRVIAAFISVSPGSSRLSG
jgi:hypothetical protein